MKSRKIKILKQIILLLVITVCLGLIIYLFPIIKNISTSEGQEMFKNKIKNSGMMGFFILLGLQIAQIFLVILPGEPLEILSGMCYGGIWGTIFLLSSVFITTTIIFYTVKRYGKEFVYNFFDKNKIDKIENSKLFIEPKKMEYILIILFMIPGTPKDLLVYIGGLLPIKPIKFILISTFARFPSIITSTLAGANIMKGNWKMMIIVYVIPIVIVGIILLIINYFDKKGRGKSVKPYKINRDYYER